MMHSLTQVIAVTVLLSSWGHFCVATSSSARSASSSNSTTSTASSFGVLSSRPPFRKEGATAEEEKQKTQRRSTHKCIHAAVAHLPGYGPNAPVSTDVRYGREGHHHHEVHLQSSNQPIRMRLVFDPDPCSASSSTCGHCKYAGHVVPTYESSSTTTVCQHDDVLTAEKRSYVMEQLMPAAQRFWELALRVQPVAGPLALGGGATCGGSPGVTIPADHFSPGVSDTDFIIYVTAAPRTDRTTSTVAWAGACRVDANGRPTAAHVNFIPNRLENAAVVPPNAIQQEQDVGTAIHEIAHALGFSSPFFGSRGYLAANGSAFISGGVEDVYIANLEKTVQRIISPRVVAAARTYFGCDSLGGVEVEDQGGAGTAGSHWEKRVYFYEGMAGTFSTVRAYFSRITLAFFEDTGHYTVDYAAAAEADAHMRWGRGKGCEFAEGRCDVGPGKGAEFCFSLSQDDSYCTLDGLSRGYCGVSDYGTSLAANFRYFGDGSANLGGRVETADYCPAVAPFSNGICVDTAIKDKQDILGNTYTASSRCFVSDLVNEDFSLDVGNRRQTRCFETCCDGPHLVLGVKGRRVPCPRDGTAGAANLEFLPGYKGSITCPPASDYGCTSSSQQTACFGGASQEELDQYTTQPPLPDWILGTQPPEALSEVCDDHIPCAEAALQTALPMCKRAARLIQLCFGTACDSTMETWLRGKGYAEPCAEPITQRREVANTQCVEGLAGYADLCRLLAEQTSNDGLERAAGHPRAPKAAVHAFGAAAFLLLVHIVL